MKTFSLGIITQDFLRSRLKFHYPICLKFHFLKTKSTLTQECKDSKHFSFNLYLKPQTAYYILCNTTYVARLSESFKNLHSTSPPIPLVNGDALRYSSALLLSESWRRMHSITQLPSAMYCNTSVHYESHLLMEPTLRAGQIQKTSSSIRSSHPITDLDQSLEPG